MHDIDIGSAAIREISQPACRRASLSLTRLYIYPSHVPMVWDATLARLQIIRPLRAANAFHSSMPRDCLAASFISSHTLGLTRTMAIALKLRTASKLPLAGARVHWTVGCCMRCWWWGHWLAPANCWPCDLYLGRPDDEDDAWLWVSPLIFDCCFINEYHVCLDHYNFTIQHARLNRLVYLALNNLIWFM